MMMMIQLTAGRGYRIVFRVAEEFEPHSFWAYEPTDGRTWQEGEILLFMGGLGLLNCQVTINSSPAIPVFIWLKPRLQLEFYWWFLNLLIDYHRTVVIIT